MFNPEFRRHVWLELSRHRLIAVPVLLFAIAMVVFASTDKAAEFLALGSLTGFFLVTSCYGAMRAFASVSDEVNERTWDFQRMSALSPWSLALGKVGGAPIFAWYTGAWLLLLFILAALGMREGFAHLGAALLGALAGSVLVHALAVAMSAAFARSGLGQRGRRAGVILGLLVLFNVLPLMLVGVLGRDARTNKSIATSTVRFFSWFEMHVTSFAALTATVFAVWALLAAWRMMARELREPPRWAVWPAFALFTGVWFWGLSLNGLPSPSLDFVFTTAVYILVLAAYLGLVIDPLTPVVKTRLARARQATPPLGWDKQLPQWVIHAGIAGGLALLAIALTRNTPLPGYIDQPGGIRHAIAFSIGLPLVLMFIRDAAILTCFTLATNVKRPLATAMFYIAMLDFLVPLLLTTLGLKWPATFFCPLMGIELGLWVPTVFMAIHALLALLVLFWRWR